MKHVHVSVKSIEQSVAFYSTLFGAAPAVLKADSAKWMLDDPRVNFAVSPQGDQPGVDHLGIQVEHGAELAGLSARLKEAGESTFEGDATTCCYAQSDKSWVNDPSGLRWEIFHTFGEATTYGEDAEKAPKAASACCSPAPAPPSAKACC